MNVFQLMSPLQSIVILDNTELVREAEEVFLRQEKSVGEENLK